MQSSNPVLSDKALKRLAVFEASDTMSVSGSVMKTAVSLVVLLVAAVVGWNAPAIVGYETLGWWLMGVSIAALVVGMVIIFRRPNPVLVLLYAALEGLLLGVVSRMFEMAFSGIVLQAILLTLATTLGMVVLFATRTVRVTEKLRSVILIATVGALLYYLFEFIVGLFNPAFITVISGGTTGVVIALLIVIIAALNLLLDFDFIDRGVAQKLPKQVEWYAAFGLMVTLIWLYVSILRLLGRSRS